jgi:MacB-like periplasmic core domain
LGAGFLPQEDEPGGAAVVLISSELWQRRFGGDPMITGKTASIDTTAYTIIGVLPPRFQFPFAGVDVWLAKPFSAPGVAPQVWRSVAAQVGFARLKGGASVEQARTEMEALSRQYVLANPGLVDADPKSTVRVARTNW